MTERINRRDLILENATELFMSKGYVGTSIRQIADASDVTEAAIYYHFKDGKRELLNAVLECEMPDFLEAIEACKEAASLPDMILKLGKHLSVVGRYRIDRFRWINSEFPHLSEEERDMFHSKHINFQQGLAQLIEPFIDDPERVNRLAWILVSTLFGFGQIFWNLDLASAVDLPLEDFILELARLFDI
jgi:AcrR family transcriptional regulator